MPGHFTWKRDECALCRALTGVVEWPDRLDEGITRWFTDSSASICSGDVHACCWNSIHSAFCGLSVTASMLPYLRSLSSPLKALVPVQRHFRTPVVSIPMSHGWRNRGGGDREGPSPPGPINSSSWLRPGGTEYITKWALLTSLGLFFSNSNSCIGVRISYKGGFGPFETLGDPFPRGPPRPSPPTSGIISPALPCLRPN